MRSTKEHRWKESDDLVVFYIARHGTKHLGVELPDVAAALSIPKNTLRMRMSNSLSLEGKGSLNHPAKLTKEAFNKYRQLSEPELCVQVLGVLGMEVDDLEKVRTLEESKGAFSPNDLEDARKRILAAIVLRQGQLAFRERLLNAYQHSCAVTDCDVVEALEAAHIVPYLGPKTDYVTNGLLLRADIHTLFDLRLIAVNPTDLRVIVSKSLFGSCYQTFAGQVVRLPQGNADYPNRTALKMTLKEFHLKECSRSARVS